MIHTSLLKPVVMIGVAAGIAVISFGGGWMLESWRSGAKIEKLEGENRLLITSSSDCAMDVHNARMAVQALRDAHEESQRMAEDAMREAEPEVAERTRTITLIKTMPEVAEDAQCEAIKREQVEYVLARRKG